ncbi:MAG: Exodeoxyribonuclease 7 large subunit [Patescibacteria group bacterium]|nr:Exodeoxyribonuclease 7 large subunit [Patescibacteria group bacterium]
MSEEVLSVTELREFVNQTLSYAYPLVVVEGEISGFRINQGKWVFFDLKDSETTISCFMTKYQLKTVLEDGMLVRVAATPNLTKWGKFSLTVKEVELAGEGEVMRAFELLKAQFEKEGLFALDRKRPLPTYPQKIGLITSRDAAAYNDFLTIAQDRWPLAQLTHIHVHVQGMQAPTDIVRAIQTFNVDYPDMEALVVIRGGGSAEDLQAFHQEDVVRAVYGSHIPVIVGIGHEDDVSLAELAADVRASTPTDAARRLLPDRREVASQLQRLSDRNEGAIRVVLDRIERALAVFEVQQARVIGGLLDRLGRTQERMQVVMEKMLAALHYRVELAQRTLVGVDPERILARGYAIVRQGAKVIHAPTEIQPSLPVLVQLHKGMVEMTLGGKEITDDETQTSLEFS